MRKGNYIFEPLGDQHDRASFSCGIEALDKYFREDPIKQDIGRQTAVAFVMTDNGTSVAGFYTLSSLSILGAELPEKLAKKLPGRSAIGVTLLGRMGVQSILRGQGFRCRSAHGRALSCAPGFAHGRILGRGGRR